MALAHCTVTGKLATKLSLHLVEEECAIKPAFSQAFCVCPSSLVVDLQLLLMHHLLQSCRAAHLQRHALLVALPHLHEKRMEPGCVPVACHPSYALSTACASGILFSYSAV